MKKQGLKVSIKELQDLAAELLDEASNQPIISEDLLDEKWQINIINKEGLSDTWEIEKRS